MSYSSMARLTREMLFCICLAVLLCPNPARAVINTNINLRVMAANLNGNSQTIEQNEIRIFQGLKPDVVAIQEFNYLGNSASEIRSFVNQAFGTSFTYFRESGSFQIPNGIISRYPILQSGSWTDPQVGNRGFAWAKIDLPGTNDLYVVSVHLLTSSASERAAEANALKSLILSNFPSGAWIIIAGDFNTQSRTESAITTFNSFLADWPIPTDAESGGKPQTNNGRTEQYDFVLVSWSMTNRITNSVFASHSFSRGLVFDSRVYTPTNDVSPVLPTDSSPCQHMAVLKDFNVPFTAEGGSGVPWITAQPRSQSVALGSNVTFSVSASGDPTLTYVWSFNGTNVAVGTSGTYAVPNAQKTNEGSYQVVVTNLLGKATSDVATLTLTLPVPYIVTQPRSQAVPAGASAAFYVVAGGAEPFAYQWRSNAVNISGATATNYTVQNVQPASQAEYSVVVTNQYGSVTSEVATLSIASSGSSGVLAGWEMNGLSQYGPSPMSPTTNVAEVMVTGLTRGSGFTTANTASGNSWGGNGLDMTGLDAAVSAGDYATCGITAKQGYRVSFAKVSALTCKRSNTGPTAGTLQYQVGTGAFANIANLTFSSTTASLAPIDLSAIPALQNVGSGINVTFRIVLYNGASGGNWYLTDGTAAGLDFAITGTVEPLQSSPAVAPGLAVVSGAPGAFQVQVTGTTGSNYVLEVSTSLGASGWLPIVTNPAPFFFEDKNVSTTPRQFFRARVAP